MIKFALLDRQFTCLFDLSCSHFIIESAQAYSKSLVDAEWIRHVDVEAFLAVATELQVNF